MTEDMNIRDAECCRWCKHTCNDFAFRDGVLCKKDNQHRYNTDVCDQFEREEKREC